MMRFALYIHTLQHYFLPKAVLAWRGIECPTRALGKYKGYQSMYYGVAFFHSQLITMERINWYVYAIAWVNLFSVELITYFMILANSFLFSLTFSARIYTQLFDAEAERNKFIEKSFLTLKMTFLMVWMSLRNFSDMSYILEIIEKFWIL